MFGKQAENCERYLSKGRLVGIQGRIQTGSQEEQRQYIRQMSLTVEFLSGDERIPKTDYPKGLKWRICLFGKGK